MVINTLIIHEGSLRSSSTRNSLQKLTLSKALPACENVLNTEL